MFQSIQLKITDFLRFLFLVIPPKKPDTKKKTKYGSLQESLLVVIRMLTYWAWAIEDTVNTEMNIDSVRHLSKLHWHYFECVLKGLCLVLYPKPWTGLEITGGQQTISPTSREDSHLKRSEMLNRKFEVNLGRRPIWPGLSFIWPLKDNGIGTITSCWLGKEPMLVDQTWKIGWNNYSFFPKKYFDS